MLRGMLAHAGFEAGLAHDPSEAARERAASIYPGLEFATSPESVIDSPDLDIVYLACPPLTHRAYAERALLQGRPVLCEKPLGVDLAESESLVATARRSATANAVNLVYGAGRAAAELQAALASGDYGTVRWVEIRLHLAEWAAQRYAEAPWLARRDQGGFIREVTTHYVFLCRRLFGDVSLEAASIGYPADGVSAAAFADVRLRAGELPITLTGTTAGAGPEVNHFTVWADGGALRVRDIHLLERSNGNTWEPAYPWPARPDQDTYIRQLDGVSAMLDGRPHTLADFAEAYEVQQVIEAIHALGGERGP